MLEHYPEHQRHAPAKIENPHAPTRIENPASQIQTTSERNKLSHATTLQRKINSHNNNPGRNKLPHKITREK